MTARVLSFPAERSRKPRRRRAPATNTRTTAELGRALILADHEQQETQAFGRGVWMAPWVGPNGETILVDSDENRRLVGEPVTVPLAASARLVANEVWDRVEP
jgi:hypothetical protein